MFVLLFLFFCQGRQIESYLAHSPPVSEMRLQKSVSNWMINWGIPALEEAILHNACLKFIFTTCFFFLSLWWHFVDRDVKISPISRTLPSRIRDEILDRVSRLDDKLGNSCSRGSHSLKSCLKYDLVTCWVFVSVHCVWVSRQPSKPCQSHQCFSKSVEGLPLFIQRSLYSGSSHIVSSCQTDHCPHLLPKANTTLQIVL